MDEQAALLRLAELAGIEPFYWDIAGNYHPTEADSARRILAAMGSRAASAAEITASIELLETAPWRRALPPVAVVFEAEQSSVPLRLAAERIETKLAWQITEEDGTRHAGMFEPAKARLEDTRCVDGREMQRRSFPIPPTLPCGYHELSWEGETTVMSLIVAPRRCYLPSEFFEGRRLWGIAAQLYTLRTADNWGIGNFSDLRELITRSARLGAAAVGINPLHALFPLEPGLASPYSPNSRLFLNSLYLDIEAIADFAASPEAQDLLAKPDFAERLRNTRAAKLVDYDTVARLKFEALECLYLSFRRKHLEQGGDARGGDFRRFQSDGGRALRAFATFEALNESFQSSDWTKWPSEFRDPGSDALGSFSQHCSRRIEFFEYLQWQADIQLRSAQRRAGDCAMALGLYRDLAVGADPHGADVWAEQDLFVLKARIGAPPDPFNTAGQEWGIPPMLPSALRQKAYKPFISLLRANMRAAGALRIDHVMALQHLFWVPTEGTADAGVYVVYPFEDLLGILALESHRNRCLLIGEDLGTVPEGFRERLAAANVLSYRVLLFEKDRDRFKRPAEYPSRCVACVSSHDLPTLKGYWSGADIELRGKLGLYAGAEDQHADKRDRDRDRRAMTQALILEELLRPTGEDGPPPAMTEDLAKAVHRYLARSPAFLMLAQLDDLVGETEQVNLPGTSFERPNWRRKLSCTLEEFAAARSVADTAKAIAEERLPETAQPAVKDP